MERPHVYGRPKRIIFRPGKRHRLLLEYDHSASSQTVTELARESGSSTGGLTKNRHDRQGR